jgi:hypothetical protein
MDADINDTQIPKEFIPLIITHWWHEDCSESGLTVTELRSFLEAELRAGLYSEGVVRDWIYQADVWRTKWDGLCPRYVDSIIEEYKSLRQAA